MRAPIVSFQVSGKSVREDNSRMSPCTVGGLPQGLGSSSAVSSRRSTVAQQMMFPIVSL